MHVCLKQGQAHLTHCQVNIRLRELSAAAQVLKHISQASS
jgi:hypothetical protein